MRRYRTVIPLHNLKLDSREPFRLGPGISIDVIPESLRNDSLLKHQSQYELEQLELCSYCFVFEYEAEALYSADPLWTGQTPRTIQAAKIELAYLANLALWLTHPSPTGFTLVFHMPEFDRFIIQGTEGHGRFLCHPDDKHERIIPEDLEPARQLFTALALIPRETAAWASLRAITAALQMNVEEIRYLLLWIALEALFGANIEIRYRISQRLAFFVANDRSEARAMFLKCKKAYDFRSRVAHGAWKRDVHSTTLTATTEALVRRALVRLLQNAEITKKFLGNNEGREAYLDDLLFAMQ